MDIKDQVCSLELAKRLKELGVKQESLFYYGRCLNKEYRLTCEFDYEYRLTCQCGFIFPHSETISAFTVAELGEMLPDKFTTYRDLSKFKGAWTDKASDLIGKLYVISDTEADARAKILIYLIENGLIKEKDDATKERDI
jgi:hypothetical protein